MTRQEPCTGHEHDHFHKRFEDADKWAKVFDDPARDAWQKPDELIRALGLKQNAVVADIGAGTGYFAIRIAKKRPRGKIIAVDVEPDMVAYLDKRTKQEGLENVEPLLVSPTTEIKLPQPVDMALVVDTYHHIPERIDYFKKLGQYIKSDGTLTIVDFTEDSPEGPPKEHRIGPDKVKEELKAAGYKPYKSYKFLPYQYFIVFKKIR